MTTKESRGRLRIALQKSGRLSDKSHSLIEQCGIDFDRKAERLLAPSSNFPIEFMLVRDDDIPEYVKDQVCDIGIVGRNVIFEKSLVDSVTELRNLEFGRCRLSLAAPAAGSIRAVHDLRGKRIATSYPNILKTFLDNSETQASIVTIAGSVEIATSLDIADAVFDLVSTGETLRANGLVEIYTVLQSEAVLIKRPGTLSSDKARVLNQLLARLDGVIKAQRARYVMMNAPSEKIAEIRRILPGMEHPTIVPLADPSKVAIHAVAMEEVFWETIERLKEVGASSILVVPIEKIID